ncbi:hypothetical protein [Mycolicibacterium sp.]|uniref:hypothetical protein n=1 Tax=Mycolicibacterium sp. TaxID=2320850 RepID=UPI003D1245DB
MDADDAHDDSARQFVAQPPFWGSKVASWTTPAWRENPLRAWALTALGIFACTGVVWVIFFGMRALTEDGPEWVQQSAMYGLQFGLLLLLVGGVYFWTRRSQSREIVLSVTTEGLTVNTRPGEVYPLRDATLGTWGETGGATMGVALHLQCGTKRFILGGRDRRAGSGTRLDAPDAGYGLPIDIDAWLPAAEFDEILALVAGPSGLDVRTPSPDDPIRCLLFPNSLKLQELGSSLRKQRQFLAQQRHPRRALVVSPTRIQLIDPTTDTLLASVSPVHVSAQPVDFRPPQQNHWFPSVGGIVSDAATNHWSRSPGLRVTIPGMAALTIGCRDTVMGLDYRFSWPADVPVEQARADYEVSGTDWQTLVETFGLTQHLVNHERSS